MASYSNLRFQAGVDSQDANPQLWTILNAVLRAQGKVGVVISGYRTPEHSVAVGGFANDPHTRGIAADVLVGGKPIGDIPGMAAALMAAGLISGAQPGFFNGKPDPGHVQLGSSGSSSAPSALPEGAVGGAQAGGGAATTGCLPAALTLGTFFALGVAHLGGFL